MTEKMDYLKFIALMEEFGISDRNFLGPLYGQLIEADGFGGDGVEFAAAVIKGAKPRDELEAMHAAQMAVMHWAAMKYLRQVSNWRGQENQDLAVNAATKLARTFASHLDALKRYRTGGGQTITVQHVTVGEGGKAIVGNVTHNPPDPMSDGSVPSTPLLKDTQAFPVPMIENRSGLTPVPVSRTEMPKSRRRASKQ